jgi:peroxiredoxin
MKTKWTLFGTLGLVVAASLLSRRASAQLKIGDPAPSFSVTNLGGRQLFWKDLQTGGPVFVYFIRDGDSVSQQTTSYINKIIKGYGTTRSTWYGIINAQVDRTRSFMAETNPAFRMERDGNMSAVKAFGVVSAPAVFEFDEQGILINTWRGYSAVNLQSINEAMAKAEKQTALAMKFHRAPSVARTGENYSGSTRSGG